MTKDNAAVDEPYDAMTIISKKIMGLSTGDRARLRRIFLTNRYNADGVVIGLLRSAGLNVSTQPEAFAPWRLLAHVAALLSGTAGAASHRRNARLGAVLHAANYSENRLLRLTSAKGAALQDQIIRAARVLAQKASGPVDLWTIVHLAGHDPARQEQARLQIARDYYTASARSEEEAQ